MSSAKALLIGLLWSFGVIAAMTLVVLSYIGGI